MEKGTTTHVGLDAHKEWIAGAIFLPGATNPVEVKCTNDRASVKRMVRKVKRQANGCPGSA